MWRVAKIVLALGAIPLCFLVWAASQAQFTFQHPRAPDVKVVVSGGGGRLALDSASAGTIAPPAPTHVPRAVTGQLRHDFGAMDPLTRGEHTFVVKNTGEAPLTLEVASTTCKCTVAGVSDNQIPPGGEGKIQLEWTVPARGPFFSQTARIRTNDPQQKSIPFTVEGRVRTSIGADREELTISLNPDKSATVELTIFSQQWENFTIAKVDSQLAELSWEQADATAETLESLQAKSGRRLRVTISSDLAATVSDTLHVTIEPRDAAGNSLDASADELRPLEIPLHVSVKRRLSIYGPAMRSSGVIEMGETPQGTAKELKLQVKVRDRDLALSGVEIETTPSFLDASLTPHRDQSTGDEVPGLYDLRITIPSDAPTCTYLGDVLGQLRIITSHPRIPETPLAVRFAVLPR